MSLDISLFHQVNGLAGQNPSLDALGLFLAHYLPYLMVIIAFGFFAYQIAVKWRWRPLWVAILSIILSKGIIISLIRWIVGRPRPFVSFPEITILIHHSTSSGFPSGHAGFFFALSMAIYLVDCRWGKAFFILATLMSLARIFVGVHYPADILAGAVVGIFSAWLVKRTFDR